MKTIKINFCGFWNSLNYTDNLFINILSRHFKVEISEQPDFIICSNRGKPFEYMKYDCVRIMFMGENLSPDWTVFDYCIGFDFMEFADRYFRLPLAFYSEQGKPWIPEKLDKKTAIDILKSKVHFCNFIYGHQSSHGMREELFRKLHEYRAVISPGSFLNNVSTNKKNKRCSWKEKNDYLAQSKLTIACDSIHYHGFVTEKIVQPFLQHSIPIYYGSTRIAADFNTKAFIECKSPEDIDKVVEYVQYLDTHDDAYLEMLMECPLQESDALVRRYMALEAFLVNIFSQNPQAAFRRIRYFCAESHEMHLKKIARNYKRIPQVIHSLLARLKK